jgi:orotidine 5'-phosphate decarboxylase subfamily 1
MGPRLSPTTASSWPSTSPTRSPVCKWPRRIGDAVSFYKIGLGMLTGGGLALANELKQDHGKRIFLDMKLFDIPATIENAVRGLAQYGLDFLTVQGDPSVVAAAKTGAGGSGLNILAVTFLTSADRSDLDAALIRDGALPDLVVERAARAFAAGADGVIASPHEAALIRALPEAEGKLIVTPGVRPEGSATRRPEAHRDPGGGHRQRRRSHRRRPPRLAGERPGRRRAVHHRNAALTPRAPRGRVKDHRPPQAPPRRS